MSGSTGSDDLTRGIRAYGTDGFAVLPSPFEPAEVEAWKAEADRLAGLLVAADADDRRIQSRGHRGQGTVRDRYDPVTEFSPAYRELATDARLRAIAARVVGSDPVLFKDRFIIKTAGTEGYGLHRDWPYWDWLGIPPDEIVSLMLSLDAADASNGALEVYPGLHHASLPEDPDDPRDLDPSGVEGREIRLAVTAPGDVLLLHPMAPHRSGPNLSGGSRRILTYVFAGAAHAGVRERYYRERDARAG